MRERKARKKDEYTVVVEDVVEVFEGVIQQYILASP